MHIICIQHMYICSYVYNMCIQLTCLQHMYTTCCIHAVHMCTACVHICGLGMFEIDEATLAQLKVGKQAETLHMSEHPVSNST